MMPMNFNYGLICGKENNKQKERLLNGLGDVKAVLKVT